MLTLGVAIPATDLTINSVILLETVKVMIVIALTHLCLGGDSPPSYVKNKVLLFFLATTVLSGKMIQTNLTTI